MVYCFAQLVTSELLEGLIAEQYKVHSIYQQGFNIRVGEALCYIGKERGGEVPYSIITEEAVPAPGLHSHFKWNKARQELSSREVTISLRKALVSSSYLAGADYPDERNKWRLYLTAMEGIRLDTGFDVSIPMQKELKSVLTWEDGKGIGTILKKWLGRGQGLTPSGDDFLIGLLYINHGYSFITPPFFEELLDLMKQEYTTQISIHYLYCALAGLYSRPLRILLKGINKGDAGMVADSIERLRYFGHTSGCDTMSGILFGLTCIL